MRALCNSLAVPNDAVVTFAGFDDPEVMAAVADVAKNPANMAKYQNKPKVMAFYKAMASMMGDKLAGMGAAAPQPPGQPPQPGPWPQR